MHIPVSAGKYKAGDLAPGQETVCECPRIYSRFCETIRGERGERIERARQTDGSAFEVILKTGLVH